MRENYDVVVVGAGPAGIFACYEMSLKNPRLKILLLDKGKPIDERERPKNGEKRSITSGFGGSGAFSDGKFNITEEFGGWLQDYMSGARVLELIKYVDNIYLKFGAPKEITNPYTEEVRDLEREGYAFGLKLLRASVRHLGTERNVQIMKNMADYLAKKIDIAMETEAVDIIEENNECRGVVLKDGRKIFARRVVIVPGRSGSFWLETLLKKYGIRFVNNQVDMGVRVETNDVIMEKINKILYEGKFIFRSSCGLEVRTFCSNPSGHVVMENADNIKLVNGHSYRDSKLGSDNTNFALLVSHKFSEPFNEPNEFASEIAHLANLLANNNVIVQKYGDIKKGRRSTLRRIEEGFVSPTLKTATPGDLGLILPYNTMKSIIEMLEALNHITPGIANEHTLLYGVEAKFYGARPATNERFETAIKNLYIGGDGAGITRGLAQAGANGVFIADCILQREESEHA